MTDQDPSAVTAARRERMIRFLADCLLTGTNPIIADEDEALTVDLPRRSTRTSWAGS